VAAAQHRGQHERADQQQVLAASYQAMHDAYAEREAVFAVVMADRADWDAATRQQRHLAEAADAELRRRHPDQQYPPLRSAEPPPATQTQRGAHPCGVERIRRAHIVWFRLDYPNGPVPEPAPGPSDAAATAAHVLSYPFAARLEDNP